MQNFSEIKISDKIQIESGNEVDDKLFHEVISWK